MISEGAEGTKKKRKKERTNERARGDGIRGRSEVKREEEKKGRRNILQYVATPPSHCDVPFSSQRMRQRAASSACKESGRPSCRESGGVDT